jgi:3D (Asp-Asp-Asp) domain-containing protein
MAFIDRIAENMIPLMAIEFKPQPSRAWLVGLSLAAIIFIAGGSAPAEDEQVLNVTATAYNSVPAQTENHPSLTAWGDTLVPGMKAIAVSRDLIAEGLTHGVKVKIDGLAGTYTVLDKLHKRWKLRIDIYMGKDLEAAKQWGRREVTIRW